MTWAPVTLDEARMMVLGDNGDYEQITREHVVAVTTYLAPSHLPPLPAGPVLEFGCGIGRVAIPIARGTPHRTVYGVDSSPRMLDLARADAEGVPNVRWYEAIPDVYLAAAYSLLTFQHLPDDECGRIVDDIARLLLPGGRLLVQWVLGTHQGGLCWERDEDTVRGWFSDAGLVLRMWMPDETGRWPTWRWVCAERLA